MIKRVSSDSHIVEIEHNGDKYTREHQVYAVRSPVRLLNHIILQTIKLSLLIQAMTLKNEGAEPGIGDIYFVERRPIVHIKEWRRTRVDRKNEEWVRTDYTAQPWYKRTYVSTWRGCVVKF